MLKGTTRSGAPNLSIETHRRCCGEPSHAPKHVEFLNKWFLRNQTKHGSANPETLESLPRALNDQSTNYQGCDPNENLESETRRFQSITQQSNPEILIQRVKKLEPEEIALRIQQFDQELCTQVFLSELKPVLPSPEQVRSWSFLASSLLMTGKVGKLNIYRNADATELAGLHPSDRLMVRLIQIERLAPRIEGMLYRVTFEETWGLLDEVCIFIKPSFI